VSHRGQSTSITGTFLRVVARTVGVAALPVMRASSARPVTALVSQAARESRAHRTIAG
jgi:hypothetical protein